METVFDMEAELKKLNTCCDALLKTHDQLHEGNLTKLNGWTPADRQEYFRVREATRAEIEKLRRGASACIEKLAHHQGVLDETKQILDTTMEGLAAKVDWDDVKRNALELMAPITDLTQRIEKLESIERKWARS